MSATEDQAALFVVPKGKRHPNADEHRVGATMYYKDALYFKTWSPADERHRWVKVDEKNVRYVLDSAVALATEQGPQSPAVEAEESPKKRMLLAYMEVVGGLLPAGVVVELKGEEGKAGLKLLLTVSDDSERNVWQVYSKEAVEELREMLAEEVENAGLGKLPKDLKLPVIISRS
ncbi:hypothetical protein QKT49_gp218 [Acanthamoeba castellanii medusavirus]|uniref:Uncharacterized protein n=1 Tax=Acanthamoeba castellanii medusavirus J1 TaxID=3114988 RepID=A0A3T1CXN5_9VIRU|nr:hypothetical protein QKT49_gp218 [Acanthamoeba castellanii medusavirus]BBI30545.1 hypothetical protein [Acanthamoeba castellanii medusavirus J1]